MRRLVRLGFDAGVFPRQITAHFASNHGARYTAAAAITAAETFEEVQAALAATEL